MSLINKMLLDLDQRMDVGPAKSTAARVLAGLRPAVSDEPPAPSRRRYELAALVVAILLAMGAYTWQKMPRPVASLEKMAEVEPTQEAADPFTSTTAPPVISLPARVNASSEPSADLSPLPRFGGGLVVEAEPPEDLDAAQVDEEQSAPEPIGRVQFPLAVSEPVKAAAAAPAAIPAKELETQQTKRAAAPVEIAPPAKRERIVVAPATVVPAVRVEPAAPVGSLARPVPVAPAVPVVAEVAPPAFARSVPPAVVSVPVDVNPAQAKWSVAAPQGRNAGLEKRAVGFNVDQAEDMHRDAIALTEQGRLAEAYDKFRDALAHDPRHVKAREGLVNVLLQQGHAAEAQDVLYEGINAVPGNVAFGQQLARLYAEQGKNEKALTLLESNRELAKGNADYLGFLAAIYQRVGQPAQAQEAYKQALALRPLDGRWWTGLAIAYEAENKWSAAREAYAHVRASLNVDEKLSDYAEKRMAILASRP